MKRRSFLYALAALALPAWAEELPHGTWGDGSLSVTIDPGDSLFIRQTSPSGSPQQLAGSYRIVSKSSHEYRVLVKVDSLVVAGGNATRTRMLGRDVKLGDEVRLRLGVPFDLTVYDARGKATLTRRPLKKQD